MKKIFNYGSFIIAIIICFSCAILRIDFAKVDDIPYHEVIKENIVNINEFTDINNTDGKLTVKGTNVASLEVSLLEGDSFLIEFEAYNPTDRVVNVYLDLWALGFDRATEETFCSVKPGDGVYSAELSFYRGNHPEKCLLRLFSYDEEAEIEIETLQVATVLEKTNNNKVVDGIVILCTVFMMLAISYIVLYSIWIIRRGKFLNNLKKIKSKEVLKELLAYLSIIVSVIVILCFLYQDAELEYPLVYSGGDEMGIYYLVKVIKEHGYTLVNPMVGGITGGDMFDYPYSDKFSFLLVKIISLFVDNVYLIANLFYFLSYMIIVCTSFYVCRKLKLSKAVSSIIAILYTFSPFIQSRYSHMWLVPYYMLPLACLISIYIIEDKFRENNTLIKNNKSFWNMFLIAYFCAFTGMYYAYFSCALFALAMFIRIVNSLKKDILKETYPIFLIFSTICGVLINILPNMLYWVFNGQNPLSELAIRNGAETEIYGLKFTQMLLPRLGHRISALARITQEYTSTYPLVNENTTSALGIIASVGFIIAILMIFNKKQELFTESKLIVGVFLIGTIGGIGTLISVFISIPMRCYNRMSLIIMFLSLLVIGKLLERIGKKVSNKCYFYLLCELFIVIGLFDQTVHYIPVDYLNFQSKQNIINVIENIMNKNDMIFVLPYEHWPSSSTYIHHIAYIESDDLIWSYGAMQGREEAVWQQTVASLDADTMIMLLREAGYDGIYFDAQVFTSLYGNEQMATYSNNITYSLGYTPVVSEDGTTYFWDIRTE